MSKNERYRDKQTGERFSRFIRGPRHVLRTDTQDAVSFSSLDDPTAKQRVEDIISPPSPNNIDERSLPFSGTNQDTNRNLDSIIASD